MESSTGRSEDDDVLWYVFKSKMCFLYSQYLYSEQFCIGAIWKYYFNFLSWLFCLHSHIFISGTSVEAVFFPDFVSVWENVNLWENLYAITACLNSLSNSEPKTKDLCTLKERYYLSDGSLYMDQETELLFSCSFTSNFFLNKFLFLFC